LFKWFFNRKLNPRFWNRRGGEVLKQVQWTFVCRGVTSMLSFI
jgi:hypothetical protein